MILPPADNEYYGSPSVSSKYQKNGQNLKLVVKNNEIIYNDIFQKSTAQNSLGSISPR